MTHLPEADLVDECRAGRRAAQHELYRRYARAMFGTCLRMCPSREDAEDVLQHAFADVFAKLHTYRGDSTVGAWIKRVVVNHCLTHLKRRRHRIVPLEEYHRHAADRATHDPDEATLDSHGRHDAEDGAGLSVAAIKSAVRELPTGFRTVLTLYLFEGYDHAEIGEVLGISEQTSKSQYSRARKRLRERLTQTTTR